jgi:hypothetical protein
MASTLVQAFVGRNGPLMPTARSIAVAHEPEKLEPERRTSHDDI